MMRMPTCHDCIMTRQMPVCDAGSDARGSKGNNTSATRPKMPAQGG
jgi:hypothetical protein